MASLAKIAVAGVLSVAMTGSVWGQAGGAGGAGGAGAGSAGGAGAGARGTAGVGARGNTGMNGINQTPFFSIQGIRSQLNLNDQQFNALNNAHREAFTQFSSSTGQLGSNLTPEQRAQKIQDLRSNFDQSMNQATQKFITDPTQQQRFNQLHMQFQGVSVFNDPQLQQKLNLTAQQRQQVQQYTSQYDQQLNKLQQTTDPQAASTQFNDLRQKSSQQINSILTPQQQQMLQQMAGAPYNFQWSDFNSQTGTRPNGTQQNQK